MGFTLSTSGDDKAAAASVSSSAGLSSSLSDETGSGAAVFGTAPTITNATLVTPILGTPQSGVLTNCTGTASGLTAGVASAVAASGITGATLAAGVTASSLTSFGASPALVTPLLGTPTSGVLTNCTGIASGLTAGNATLAASATILANTRAINGVSFNGSADITVTAAAGTLSGATLASGVTASSLTSFGASPTLVTPALGTPASGTLTNCTGLKIDSGVVAGSQTGVVAFFVRATAVSIASGAISSDIATITIPAGITRWRITATATTACPSCIYCESAVGTLAGANFTIWDGAGGTGTQVSAILAGPSGAGTVANWAAASASAVSTANTIYVRQTGNSVNTGVCSFYIVIQPLPAS